MKIIKLTKESIQDLLEHLLKRSWKSSANPWQISAAFMKNRARIPGLTLGKRALSWASV